MIFVKSSSTAEGAKDLANTRQGSRLPAGEVMVRVNAVETEWAEKDVDEIVSLWFCSLSASLHASPIRPSILAVTSCTSMESLAMAMDLAVYIR